MPSVSKKLVTKPIASAMGPGCAASFFFRAERIQATKKTSVTIERRGTAAVLAPGTLRGS